MPMGEVTVFAWIGALPLLGIFLAALALISYCLFGGPIPPLFGGLCLAIVAAALSYGRRRLASSNG
jgi:hypothetical protein